MATHHHTTTVAAADTAAVAVRTIAQPAGDAAKLVFSCLASVASEVEDQTLAAADRDLHIVTNTFKRAAPDTPTARQPAAATTNKSAWLQRLETVANETASERLSRLKAEAARRKVVSKERLGLPVDCFMADFGSVEVLEQVNAALDALHDRLDDCADRLDEVLAGFETRALRMLLEASRTPDGGRDGAMFMQSFKPMVDEWSRRREENQRCSSWKAQQQLATAVAAAKPLVDTGLQKKAIRVQCGCI